MHAAIGLGAIAVTDGHAHRRRPRDRTACGRSRARRHCRRGGQDRRARRGDRPLPRARNPARSQFDDIVAAIRSEDGASSTLPHPFDRMHSITGSERRCTAACRRANIFEVYNARLLFEAYNDEALRFARKYNLTMGAGSDAHVLQEVGTGALRAFHGREEFLQSLQVGHEAPAVPCVPPVSQVDGPGQGTGSS